MIVTSKDINMSTDGYVKMTVTFMLNAGSAEMSVFNPGDIYDPPRQGDQPDLTDQVIQLNRNFTDGQREREMMESTPIYHSDNTGMPAGWSKNIRLFKPIPIQPQIQVEDYIDEFESILDNDEELF